MAYGLNDRVREQVSAFAGGTGAVTLPVSAVSGFQTFLSGWGASGTGEYCLVIGAQWETGFGTLNAGGTTLTRTTTYNGSSGSGVAVNFNAGTMDCFGDIPAELAHYLNMREITVASAATCDIGAVAGSNIVVSGTVTITSFGTKANRRRYVRFSGALILTHNGTSLILPGAVNRTTVAGDTAIFQSDASGNWRCVVYQPGTPKAPTTQVFLSGSGTYTTPANVVWIEVLDVGGGGGGGGGGSGSNNGAAGSATTFSTLTANGGAAGAGAITAGGAGGTASGGYANWPGNAGGNGGVMGATGTTGTFGGVGGSSAGIPGGGSAGTGGTAPGAGLANSGGGGGGGFTASASQNAGGGGGAGGTVKAIINSPAATYSYNVGGGGAGGTIGTGSQAGAAGGSGIIIVIEHYGS